MTNADTGQQEIRDFTLPSAPIRFKIDDDEFAAPAIISLITLKKIAKLYQDAAPKLAVMSSGNTTESEVEAALDAVAAMFRALIPGPSGQRFAERLLSETEPIDLNRQAMPVLEFLMGRYGLRPTQPSSASSNGSSTPSDDISSTAGASAAESTS